MLIISFGIPKSASTFTHSLIEYMLKLAGHSIPRLSPEAKGNRSKLNYIDSIQPNQLKPLIDEVANKTVVIKTHGGQDQFKDLMEEVEHVEVFVQHRDPREVALSLIDHGKRSRRLGITDFAECVDIPTTLPVIDASLHRMSTWQVSPTTHTFSYDEISFSTDESLQRIARILNIDVNIDRVLEEFRETAKIGQFNKGLRHRWKDEMSHEESQIFVSRYADYYERYQLT